MFGEFAWARDVQTLNKMRKQYWHVLKLVKMMNDNLKKKVSCFTAILNQTVMHFFHNHKKKKEKKKKKRERDNKNVHRLLFYFIFLYLFFLILFYWI